MWCVGSVAPQHVESSWSRDRSCVPCIGRRILNHWTPQEVMHPSFAIKNFFVLKAFFTDVCAYICICICTCKGKDSFLSPHPSHSLPEETVVPTSASRSHAYTSRLIYCSLCFPSTFSVNTHTHTHTCTHVPLFVAGREGCHVHTFYVPSPVMHILLAL